MMGSDPLPNQTVPLFSLFMTDWWDFLFWLQVIFFQIHIALVLKRPPMIGAAGSTHKKIAVYGRRVTALLSFDFVAADVAGDYRQKVEYVGGVICCKKTQGIWRFHALRWAFGGIQYTSSIIV
jgi:hypothetical protein